MTNKELDKKLKKFATTLLKGNPEDYIHFSIDILRDGDKGARLMFLDFSEKFGDRIMDLEDPLQQELNGFKEAYSAC